MFDIGFWELAVIGVVVLLVVGPERLPAVARGAGKWVGRAQRMVAGLKAEIDREIAADELKRHLENQSGGIHEILEETRQIGEEIDRDLRASATAAESLTGRSADQANLHDDAGGTDIPAEPASESTAATPAHEPKQPA